MDRERRLLGKFLTLVLIGLLINSCMVSEYSEATADVTISIKDCSLSTKAELPNEEKISDINIMIFDEYGNLEKNTYQRGGQLSFNMTLLKGTRYSFYACVNFGYEVKVNTEEELKNLEYHLAYPDEYREGIPMAAVSRNVLITKDCIINLEAERLMARISLKMDRSRLSENVRMDVIGVRIGNCPKKVRPFTDSHVKNEDECFRVGFRYDDISCHPLNQNSSNGLSNELSLYMLENMQGLFSPEGPASHQEKVFKETDHRRLICSYIELELEYIYGDMASIEQPLIYRFYLGDGLNSLDVERNCHYHMTITPEDDGLNGDGWRVDKSGISFIGKPELQQYPSDYIRGDIGDVIHIGCKLNPPDTPFDVGLEYLEDDRSEGIYDYVIDEDGHGGTLTLTGPGRGLIYMEASEPINDAALFIIEVNL